MSRRSALKGAAALTFGLPAIATALAACTPEQLTLSSEYSELIIKVSDLVIPQTDTPGALAAGVPDYVRAVVGAFMTDTEQAEFKAGLAEFDSLAHALKAESFLAAKPDQQVDILKTLDARATSNEDKQGSWNRLRDMIIFGYYTSEAATQELRFEEIPGRYVGDASFQEGGRAWLSRGV
jgi:hypothetical protein